MDEYKDIITIDPKYWGRCGWIFLNSIALTYDETLKEKYKEFILTLPYILPCKKCGHHLKESINKIQNIDSILNNKETFINWLLEIRNNICKDQNRETKSIDNCLNEIFNKDLDNKIINNNEDNEIKYIVIVLIILVIIYFVYFFCNKRKF
jgi:hypothetical protein